MTDLIKLTIDGKEIEVAKGTSVLRACEIAGVQVPRFCYHSRLSIAGNCRMCLVEIEGAPKPVASCAFPAAEGQVIKTQSQIAKDARKAVMEFLLANHPLDCPLCDQGGECDLQDFSMGCGTDKGNFSLEKRTVNNPDLGPYIETFMNRCIHCMRCVRFSDEIAGKNEIGGLFRGGEKIITNSENGPVKSNLSGNMIDLCPVGALTSKPAKYTARTWELAKNETIDVLDSVLPSIYADTKSNKVMRIRARENEEINQEWISDLTRFSYDGLYNNRIKEPMFNAQVVDWNKAFDEILECLHEVNPKNISSIVGSNLAVEDVFAFKEFMQKTVGANNISLYQDINLKAFNKENVVFSSTIASIDNADAILFIGTDLENYSPLLNSRIFQNSLKQEVKVFNIGKNLENYAYKINNLIQTADILLEEIKPLETAFKKAKNAIIFVDVENILSRTDADGIIAKLELLKNKYNAKINFYSKDSGLINAVDMINSKDIVANKKLIKLLENDEVEVLFVYGNQNIDEKTIRKAKKVIYIGTHNNEVSKIADIILPTTVSTEKNSLWNNVEGRVLESKAITLPFEQSKVDWKIWRALSEFVGEPLAFNNLEELRDLISACNNSYKKENIGSIVKSVDYIVNLEADKINKQAISSSNNIKFSNEVSKNSKYYK
jgi:NADH-quinone oxidoreductase subunit G